jgi:hypothetical protein
VWVWSTGGQSGLHSGRRASGVDASTALPRAVTNVAVTAAHSSDTQLPPPWSCTGRSRRDAIYSAPVSVVQRSVPQQRGADRAGRWIGVHRHTGHGSGRARRRRLKWQRGGCQ